MANGPAATETRHLCTLFTLGAAGCLTDGQLLERFATLRGDPAELAFAALVDRHGPMVLRVARSALVDEHSAHDAFQATFLILARKARSLWVRDSLGPWLHAVACRVASQSRAADARRRMMEKEAARPEAHQPRDGDRSDLVRAIHQEIERLPTPYRLAVVTCHLEGLTQHEAAARLGWPVGTLQSRLARGRRRLRDRLRRRGLAPSLGVLAGKIAPVPHALTASTAKAASTLYFGETAAGLIAPAVLALIETATKEMLMTKLKLGAAALAMACGLVGSGMALGLGRNVKATDDPPTSGKVEPTRVVAPSDAGPASEPLLTPQDGGGKPGEVIRGPIPIEPENLEPSLTDLPLPKPWETVVRIKMHHSVEEWGFASGTVIFSSAEESIILTCGHCFRVKESPQPSPRDLKVPIAVDLFGNEFVPGQPTPRLACTEKDLPGEAIDYDFTNNVGLIRIRPGRKLPASPVVPTSWQPKQGMRMTTVGCSHGNDATAWTTTILDPRVGMSNTSTKQSFATIKCANQPKEGRSGGGLYTPDGYVAGVCAFADPNEHVGLYAVPEAIHKLLDRNGMASLYRKAESEDEGIRPPGPPLEPAPPTVTAPKADEKPAPPNPFPKPVATRGFPLLLVFLDSDAMHRPPHEIRTLLGLGYPLKLIDFQESLELANKYGVIAPPTIVLVGDRGLPMAELRGNIKPTDVARFYNLNASKWAGGRPQESPAGVEVADPFKKSPASESSPARAVSDQERRLDEQERKLDQVLKALESLKGAPPSDRREGVLRP